MSILNWDPEGKDLKDWELCPSQGVFLNDKYKLACVFETELKTLLRTSPNVKAVYELIRVTPATNLDLIPIFVAYIKTTEAQISEYQKLLKEKLNG